ncbi:MAG: hypothetical protein JWL90_1122 [Chthoniobacteraceae bacterium]|nr:hypothetical protein [Chthoniobacteraceae bacterium]
MPFTAAALVIPMTSHTYGIFQIVTFAKAGVWL